MCHGRPDRWSPLHDYSRRRTLALTRKRPLRVTIQALPISTDIARRQQTCAGHTRQGWLRERRQNQGARQREQDRRYGCGPRVRARLGLPSDLTHVSHVISRQQRSQTCSQSQSSQSTPRSAAAGRSDESQNACGREEGGREGAENTVWSGQGSTCAASDAAFGDWSR